jgi:hypothetical protein
MTELVYTTLNKSGIEIPFPTRTLYVKETARSVGSPEDLVP